MENKNQPLPAAADNRQPCAPDLNFTWPSDRISSDTSVEDRIHNAVLAERERCAKVAEDFSFTDYREILGYGSVVDESQSRKRLASEIRGICGTCDGDGCYTKHGGEFNDEYNPYRQCHKCDETGKDRGCDPPQAEKK